MLPHEPLQAGPSTGLGIPRAVSSLEMVVGLSLPVCEGVVVTVAPHEGLGQTRGGPLFHRPGGCVGAWESEPKLFFQMSGQEGPPTPGMRRRIWALGMSAGEQPALFWAAGGVRLTLAP